MGVQTSCTCKWNAYFMESGDRKVNDLRIQISNRKLPVYIGPVTSGNSGLFNICLGLYVSQEFKKIPSVLPSYMCSFKLKVNQNHFRPRLRPVLRWGSLRFSSRLLLPAGEQEPITIPFPISSPHFLPQYKFLAIRLRIIVLGVLFQCALLTVIEDS